MLTPQRIQDLADPIEEVYIHIVDELLVNIGRHVTSPNWTHTASWEIQKLSELGQLTRENAAIINRWIKTMPQAVRDTMEATRAAALDQIEREMEKAAQAGYLTPPERDSTVTVLRDLSNQAIDKYNLTNTQMLQSSVAQYAKAVNLTAQEYARLTARAGATQGILNEAAASVASGTVTRLTAVRRALTRISDEGLTGFIDKAGRSWSPEAYVNMVTRTTVHNVAVQSVQARMQDYNAQVFQVSAHAGARPLCYPYQGKLYSWDNTAGEIEAGDGKFWRYSPLKETSYGQPAGLFGINCGHSPIPVIPGVSIPHAQDFVQPKEENDKAYAESQEQRELERKIREAKRVVEMAGQAATAEDKAKVRELQKQMREFIDRTGRTRRYDREQIGGEPKTSGKKSDGMFHTYHDPMREKMGSAFDSHPREMQKTLKALERKGVEVVYREGSMGYSPALKGGAPGRMIMDHEASYSAWLHELKHLKDDEDSGWRGMDILIHDKQKAADLEDAAYKVEIDFARKNGYNLIARRLERLSFERRQELLGTQKGNKQPHE